MRRMETRDDQGGLSNGIRPETEEAQAATEAEVNWINNTTDTRAERKWLLVGAIITLLLVIGAITVNVSMSICEPCAACEGEGTK